MILSKVDSFVVKQTDNLINSVIGLVLISSGLIMMFDHRGLNQSDILFMVQIGSIFLISGTILLALSILTMYLISNPRKIE